MKLRIDMEVVDALYDIGAPMWYIGSVFNCNAATILNRMKEHGIKRRDSGCGRRGKKSSDIHKARISAANKGKTLPQEVRLKISAARIGIPYVHKGKRKATHPDEIKHGMVGDRHWNWKGGISAESNRARQSSEYKAWRDAVFARDDFTCVFCNKRGGYIQADHIQSFSKYVEIRFDISNGRTLCRECHKERTKRQRKSNYI